RWRARPIGTSSVVHVLQGHVAFRQRQNTLAKSHYERALKAEPANVEADIFLQYARIRLGSSDDVETILRAHRSHPKWGGFAWLILGELRRAQERFEDAEDSFTKALESLKATTAPPWMRAEVFVQRALAWQQAKGWDHPNVEAYLQRATEVSSGYPEALYAQGVWALSIEPAKPEASIPPLERFLKVRPRDCQALRSIARAHKLLGHDTKSSEYSARSAIHCAPK
ncbi:MAG: tetratricopeptide repeat protein, partial [Myxococcota bacterium]